MRYPEFLKESGTIGLIAPSLGVSDYPYEERYHNAVKKFSEKGYKIKECKHLYGIKHARSTSAKIRAKEFMQMYLDDEVDFIISVAGGLFMREILPYVNFNKLRKANPKYVMGMSDNTNLTFTLPLLTDTASIYGFNFGSFGMEDWDASLLESYEVITGNRLKQHSYSLYEGENPFAEETEGHALDSYYLTEKVVIKSVSGNDEQFKGRLIGGCLDCLVTLCGTPYGDVANFLDKYQEDGFIWFLESYDLNALSVTRALWQLKNAGWFKNCKGIMFGRPIHPEDVFGVSYLEAIKKTIGDLNVPIIYGCDFGHIPPSWTMIAGSYATVTKKGEEAEISFELR